MKTWQCGRCGYNSNTRAKVLRHLQSRHPDADRYNSLINLGLRLTLDLKKYRRDPPPGAIPAPEYVVVEVTEEEEEEVNMESQLADSHMVEVRLDMCFIWLLWAGSSPVARGHIYLYFVQIMQKQGLLMTHWVQTVI